MKFRLPKKPTPNDLVFMVELLENLKSPRGFGFKRYQSTYRTLQAYAHPALGIVIKKQNCILEPHTPLRVRVPTIKLKNGWVAQPLVKKVQLRKACDIIRHQLKREYQRGLYPDVHVGNVGWYAGKPVLFDW